MSNFKLKQSLKKKSILLTSFIMCSLLMSEKVLAVWDKSCYKVIDSSQSSIKNHCVEIFFKFFEYEKRHGVQISYLEQLEVEYSKDGAKTFTPLMSARTENQILRTSAWIELTKEQAGSKIDLLLSPTSTNVPLKDGKICKVWKNFDPIKTNQAWIEVAWYLREEQNYPTHIRIMGLWTNLEINKIEFFKMVYKIKPKKAKMNSNSLNFSDSSTKQEITIDAKNNTVKAYKEANAIVVKGALNENIRVYTTSGILVNSIVADCDVVQIPVPANQLYIVNVGQGRHKVAL